MNLEELKEKLRKYKKEDIIITEHAKIQAITRNIDLNEAKENITNPKRLVYAEKQEALKADEEKYNCYFAYSKLYAHRYIITINRKVIIVTIVKINRNWQREIDKK